MIDAMSEWSFARVSDDSYGVEGNGKRYLMTFRNHKLDTILDTTNPAKTKSLSITGARAKELSAALGQELRAKRLRISAQHDAWRATQGRWIIKIKNSPGLHLYTAFDTYNDRLYNAYLNDDYEVTRLVNVTNEHRELDPRGHTARLIKAAMRKQSSSRTSP